MCTCPRVLLLAALAVIGNEQPLATQARTQSTGLPLTGELRVGSSDGPPEYAFGSINLMSTRSDGSFYLLDDGDTQIRRYDSRGRFRGLVGRLGSGPGEYRRITGMGMSGDTLLLVLDPANGRITEFDTTGTPRRVIQFSRGEFYGEKAFGVDQNGLIYVRTGALRGPGVNQYVRLHLDGTVFDSLPLPLQPTDESSFVLLTADGPRWSFPIRDLYAVDSHGGVVFGNSASYSLTRAPDNRSRPFVDRHEAPVPLTVAERNEWLAWARYMSRTQSRPATPIPQLKPIVRDLFVDSMGRIWVNLYTVGKKRAAQQRRSGDARPVLTIREANVYDIWDDKGAYVGRIELPPASRLLGVARDLIWVRTEDGRGDVGLTRFKVEGLRSR